MKTFTSNEKPKVVNIYKVTQSKEGYDGTIIHEIAHVLDHNYVSKLYGISNSPEWIEAYKLDKKYIIEQGKKIKHNGFVSDYAKNSYKKSISYKYDNPYSSRFADDFADSVECYFMNRVKFEEYFPNRAKIIKNLIG